MALEVVTENSRDRIDMDTLYSSYDGDLHAYVETEIVPQFEWWLESVKDMTKENK